MAGGLGTQVMQTPAMQANREQFGNLGVPSSSAYLAGKSTDTPDAPPDTRMYTHGPDGPGGTNMSRVRQPGELGYQTSGVPDPRAGGRQLGQPSQGGGGKGGMAPGGTGQPQNPYAPSPYPFQGQNYGAARFMNPMMQSGYWKPQTYQAPATNFGSLVGGNFGRPMYGPSFGQPLMYGGMGPGAGPGGPGADSGVGIGGVGDGGVGTGGVGGPGVGSGVSGGGPDADW